MSKKLGTKIDPREFMNTTEELHAFTHGICEIICPWPPYRRSMSRARNEEFRAEYHYYLLGRAAGILAWFGLAVATKAIFF